jgi:flagellum-specific peptidoglycan hydrolase FlgJ
MIVEQRRDPTRTVVSATDLYAVLRAAWRQQLGTDPLRASLLVLLSQWSLETADGAKCMNWNLGGIKWTPACGHDYAAYDTHEVIGGKTITVVQRFRAYDNLDQGAADYLRLLRTRFAASWPAVEAGDPADFARRLKAAGYYTAPEQEYESGLRSRYTMLDKAIGLDTTEDLIADAGPILDPEA